MQSLDNNTLVLEILRQENQLAMSIFEKEELASTIRHYSQIRVSFTEIDKLCQEIISILNKADNEGALEIDLIHSLKKCGQLLWDHLLTKPVKDKLKSAKISDLILSLDEPLIHIPWELLYNGSNFLCLDFNLGRLVRTREHITSPQYRSLPAKHKMLILANPTNDLKAAYQEGLYIKNQFDKKRKEMSIDFKSTQIDTLYVKKNLCDYDIVHFAGHCEYDKDEPKNSGWALSDGRFTIQDILSLGESLSLPSLIFSNACYSAKVKAGLVDSDYQTKTYSLASAFLFSGVRLYIGAIRKIEDRAGLGFSREFYTQLINGKSVGQSMRLARLELIKEYGIAAVLWASYLLYGDPNFVLFRPKPKPAISKFKRGVSLSKKHFAKIALAVSIISVCIYLYIWLPTLNPNTYALFIKARKLFLEGRNQEVIALSSRIIQKEPAFLAAYPLLADTYYKLGDPEAALKYYFAYARACEKRNDKKNLSSAYLGIGWIYLLQGEYPKSFDFYNKAITLSLENKDKLGEARALERLAVWYIDKENNDKALELLMKSSEINRQRQYSREHRYGLACDYFDIGLVFTNKDDYVAAKDFYAKSRLLFEQLNLKHELSDCYFNLGEICLFEKKYQEALDNYMKGLKIDQEQGNKRNISSGYNMLGELYVQMDNLKEAEKFFHRSILIGKTIEAPLELASAYYNLGLLYKQQGQKNKARDYFQLAEGIYRGIDTPAYEKVKQELFTK